MKKSILAIAAGALFASVSLASAADSIKVDNFGNGLVVGGQLDLGVGVGGATGIAIEQTVVNANTNIESAQQVKKIDVNQAVSAGTIGIQISGFTGAGNVGVDVKKVQQVVGSNVGIDLK